MKKNKLLRPWTKNKNEVLIKKGEGIYLFDINNKKYIDFTSGSFNINLGYSNCQLINSINKQLKTLPYLHHHFMSDIRMELAELLTKETHKNFAKTYICCGGSEAVEAAMKFAKHFNKKNKFISLKGSFHGSGEITSELSYDFDEKKSKTNKNFLYVEAPLCFRCPLNMDRNSCQIECFGFVEETINKYHSEISAIFVEPVIGINSFTFLPPEYLRKLREICNKNNVLLIFDEVLSGFYRTGKFCAYMHSGVIPDIVCLSKGMNSGYIPVGATLVSKKISDYLEDNPLEYGNTNMAHQISCASSVETLKLLRSKKMKQALLTKEQVLLEECNKLKKKYPGLIGDVRGKGLLFVIELIKNKVAKTKFSKRELSYLLGLLFDAGIIIDADPTKSLIPLAPPFIISTSEIKEAIRRIDRCLKKFRISSKFSFFSLPKK
jgi:4-aminobutyrate aminotransferase-like enzyme